MLSKKAKIFTPLGLSFVLWLALDLLTKKWAVSPTFEPVHLLGNWFYLTEFQKNMGMAFSIEAPRFLLIGGTFLILIFLLVMGLKHLLNSKKPSSLQAAMLGLVLAGGVGNLWERIFQGYVVDFIVLKPIPVFNIADVGITLGLAVLFVTMLIDDIKNKKS